MLSRTIRRALPALALLLCASPARAELIELRHDTLEAHSEAAAVCGFAKGEALGVRFTPPAYPAVLKSVKVLLSNIPLSASQCSEGPVKTAVVWPLEIFHATAEIPGQSLVQLGGQLSNDKVMNVLDVSSAALSIAEGAFFVSFTLDTSDSSPMHDASGSAKTEENYIFGDIGTGPAWHSFSALGKFAPGGNWVLRVEVDVPDGSGAGGSAGSGAGGSDAGSGGSDAGAGGSDGGSGGSDAGAGGSDAGAGGSEAGAGGAEAGAGAGGSDAGAAGQGGSDAAGTGGTAGAAGSGGTAGASAPAPDPSEDSGCSVGARGAWNGGGWGFLGLALAALRRRRAAQ
jgi:MYXO-CTERM domain-containing protein